MAFASVQDSTARGGLLSSALKDPNANVRAAATWSLSFVPDSAVTNALVIAARQETRLVLRHPDACRRFPRMGEDRCRSRMPMRCWNDCATAAATNARG
jgi:hypothetical protein